MPFLITIFSKGDEDSYSQNLVNSKMIVNAHSMDGQDRYCLSFMKSSHTSNDSYSQNTETFQNKITSILKGKPLN